MVLLLATASFASDPVLDALSAELDRTMSELKLEDADGPYHVSMRLYDVHSTSARGQLGGLVDSDAHPFRELAVGVRVGSAERDNSNFDTWDDGWGRKRLVLGDEAMAIRHDAWLLLDEQYKDAVEALAAKDAVLRRKAAVDDVPDFAPGPPQRAEADPTPPADAAALEEVARELSAVFLAHPDVEWSQVWTASETGRRVMLDSGGTRVVEPLAEIGVRVAARARAEDGATVVDQVLFLARTVEGLPPLAEMVADVEALAGRLERWRGLPVAEEEYVGPVWFADDAAVDLFRHVLLPALQGTPAKESAPKGSRVMVWDDEEEGSTAMRVRRRVLPTGWDVVDDPGADPSLPSAYRFDWEGEPAQRVELVLDGVIRTHLMSRTPSKAVPASNGHARGFGGSLPRAMPAITEVVPPRTASERKLHKRALGLAADYDLDHYVIVRRLADPATSSMDGGPMLSFRGMLGFGAEGLPAPIDVVRVYADGREEPVRGLQIAGLDARALKEIAMAGPVRERTLLMSTPDGGASALGGFPVTITGPEVLLEEAELAPAGGNVEKPPMLPSPLAGR